MENQVEENEKDMTFRITIDDHHKDIKSVPQVIIFGINISHLSSTVQFTICCSGVFTLYLIYGYIQELIFKLEGFKPFGWYLTLIQFLFYTIFALVEKSLKSNVDRRIPLRIYAFVAFLTISTMGLSNASLGYLNYPTQVIFKCCKLIPVLIGGILIQGKKYTTMDYIACLSMSLGLVYFTLADSIVSPKFDIYGILLISLALCADAVIGNYQEYYMNFYNSDNNEMVLYSYSIGFIYILIGQVLSGDIVPAFKFCLDYMYETYFYAFLFSLSGYLGVSIVLSMVKRFGALVTVTATTCRKALTIILSFIFFAKPFTIQYIFAGSIVLLGIYLNIASKNKINIIDIIVKIFQTKGTSNFKNQIV